MTRVILIATLILSAVGMSACDMSGDTLDNLPNATGSDGGAPARQVVNTPDGGASDSGCK